MTWDRAGADPRTRVKVCGVTSVVDALMCVEEGVDAIGLNFWPGSPRCVGEPIARQIVEQVGERVETVGLFVDADVNEMHRVRRAVGFSWLQLHGQETPETFAACAPNVYKALRVSGPETLHQAALYPSELVLLDAFVAGKVGGTGKTFDWALTADLAKRRHIILAGGLHAENVAAAIQAVHPFAVDVASGVESAPGKKERARVREFIAAVRAP